MSRVAWACFVVGLALAIAGTALALSGDAPLDAEKAFSLAFVVTAGTVGAAVASRHPRNPIGWILCGLTVWAGVEALARGFAEYSLAGGDGFERWGERAAWVGAWSFVPFIFVPATFLLLLFPDGRLPSPRFRAVAWSAGAVIAFWIVTTAVDPGPLPGFETVANPYGVDSPALQLASDLVAPLMFVCVVASVVSVVSRARRAAALERQQLKWLAFAACFQLAMFVIAGVLSDSSTTRGVFFAIGVLSLPVAMGVAMLRYRLYDIDVVINRTLVYVPLIALIGGVSTALVPFSQRLVRGVTGSDSDAGIVLTALLVAALVTPLRKRLEAVVEGRFKLPAHPGSDGNPVLDDPQLVALVQAVAERAAREAVDELVARRELPATIPRTRLAEPGSGADESSAGRDAPESRERA